MKDDELVFQKSAYMIRFTVAVHFLLCILQMKLIPIPREIAIALPYSVTECTSSYLEIIKEVVWFECLYRHRC
jgi:hypothetical protein